MNRRLAMPIVALVAVTLLAGCQQPKKGGKAPVEMQPLSILRQQSGNDPALRFANVVLINDAEQLAATGSSELGNLNVDFNNESLILLTMGQKPTAGYWVRITGVQQVGDTIQVQGLANEPAADESAAQVLSFPYDAAVIPKAQGKLRVDVDSKTGLSEPTAE